MNEPLSLTNVHDGLRPESFAIPQTLVQYWTDPSLGIKRCSQTKVSLEAANVRAAKDAPYQVLERLTILRVVRLLDVGQVRLVIWCDNQTATSVILRNKLQIPRPSHISKKRST